MERRGEVEGDGFGFATPVAGSKKRAHRLTRPGAEGTGAVAVTGTGTSAGAGVGTGAGAAAAAGAAAVASTVGGGCGGNRRLPFFLEQDNAS